MDHEQSSRVPQGVASSRATTEAERLAEVARRTSNSVIVTGADGRTEWVNEGCTRITGYSLADLVGRKPGEVLQGLRSDKAEVARLSAAIRAGTSVTAELFNYAKDGREYLIRIEMEPLRDHAGRLTGFMAIESDVTEQRRAEAGALSAKDRYELAISGTCDGLWDWDILTDTVFYAPRFKQLLGYAADDPDFPDIYASFRTRLHPDDLVRTEALLQLAIDNGRPYEAVYRLRTREGDWRWFQAKGAVRMDAAGRTVRMAGAISDITDRIRAEEDLRKAKEAA